MLFDPNAPFLVVKTMCQVTLAFSMLLCLFHWTGLKVALGQDDRPAEPLKEVVAEGRAIAEIFGGAVQGVVVGQEPVPAEAGDGQVTAKAKDDKQRIVEKQTEGGEKAEDGEKAEGGEKAKEDQAGEENDGGGAGRVQDFAIVLDDEAGAMEGAAEDPLTIVLTGYMKTECGLARRACELSPEQVVALEALNVKWIKEQVAKPEKGGQMKVMQGLGRFLGGGVIEGPAPDHTQTHKRVCKQIDEVIQKTLSSAQYELFAAEREARDAFQREATASALVAVYDNHVFVKNNQREKLIADVAKWVKSKKLYWQFYFQNDAYIPAVPNSVLAKTLDDKQLQSLKGLNSYSYEMDEVQMQMNGMRQNFEFNDE